MQLQPGENIILSSNSNSIVLTNIRIYAELREWGYYQKTYIFLEDVSSVKMISQNILLLVIIAALCAVYAVFNFMSMGEFTRQSIAGLGMAVLFLLAWWFSRRRIISVHPNGGKPIEFSANLMREEAAEDFLEKLQLAKTERLHMLYKTNY